jgi:hypothetical protein
MVKSDRLPDVCDQLVLLGLFFFLLRKNSGVKNLHPAVADSVCRFALVAAHDNSGNKRAMLLGKDIGC